MPKLPYSLLCALLLLAVAAPPCSSAQQTIYVYGTPNYPAPNYPYKTIQSGIDAASSGDTVVVSPGPDPASAQVYNEDIDFKGKAITVTGLAPGAVPATATLPILRSDLLNAAVTFHSGETARSILSYFSIQNSGGAPSTGIGQAYVTYGAIYVNAAAPSILYNTISGSACQGIEVIDGAPLIQGNTISGTLAGSACETVGIGGGSAISITGETGDQTLPSGATAASHIMGNLIQNNTSAGLGYEDNRGFGPGGGITVSGSALIENNVIRNNAANNSTGGGIKILYATGMTIVQNLIYGNSSNCGGGGIDLPDSGPGTNVLLLIANNTIVDNFSGELAQTNCAPSTQLLTAIEDPSDSGPEIVIVNNILSDTSAYPSANCPLNGPPSEATQSIFDHNILLKVGALFFGPNCVDVSGSYGNLAANVAADSLFNDQAGDDFTLKSGSPAIDAGNTSALQLFHQLSGTDLPTDFANDPRLADATHTGDPTIDIGAYEFQPAPPGPSEPGPTTMVLSFSTDLEKLIDPYTATVDVESAVGVPVGRVEFLLDGVSLGSATIDSHGVATLTGFHPSTGVHSLLATYAGHGNFQPGFSVINIIDITLLNTTLYLNYSTPDILGQPITFTVGVSAEDSSIPSPILVTDLTTGTLLATLTPDAHGSASFDTTSLVQGLNNIEASYAGTSVYASSNVIVPVTVGGYPTLTTLSCGPLATIPSGASVPLAATVSSKFGTPTGSVDFSQGQTSLGQSVLVESIAALTASPGPGSNIFTATFNQQGAFDFSSGSCTVLVEAITLSSSANPAPTYSAITFTAAIPLRPVPSGTFSLTIGSDAPVTMTPSADGTTAAYTTAALAEGQYSVVVILRPAGHAALLTASLSQRVTAAIGDFTLAGPAAVTFPTGSSGTGTLVLTSVNGFTGAVSLTCNPPFPTNYLCTLSPLAPRLPANGTATASITLHPGLHSSVAPPDSDLRIVLATLLPLTLLAFARRRNRLTSLLNLVLLATLACSLSACGSNVFTAATPPGAYSITVTAGGTTPGNPAPVLHSLPLLVVITR